MESKPLLSWKEAAVIVTAGTILSLGTHSLWHLFFAEGPQHGGQMRMAGPYHVELVMKKDRMEAYLTDHAGYDSDMKNVQMTASYGNNGEVFRVINLQPSGGNRMMAKGKFNLNENTIVEVKVDRDCEQPVKTFFMPMVRDSIDWKGIICTQPEPVRTACHGQVSAQLQGPNS